MHALAEHRHHRLNPEEPSLNHAWLKRMQDFLPGVSNAFPRCFFNWCWACLRFPPPAWAATPRRHPARLPILRRACHTTCHMCSPPPLHAQDNQRLAKLQAWLEERHTEMAGIGTWLHDHMRLPVGGALHITLPRPGERERAAAACTALTRAGRLWQPGCCCCQCTSKQQHTGELVLLLSRLPQAAASWPSGCRRRWRLAATDCR